MSEQVSVWKCPHCGARNLKHIYHGKVLHRYPDGRVILETLHADDCPICKGKVNGTAIIQGSYDDAMAHLVVDTGWILGFGVVGAIVGGVVAAWKGVNHWTIYLICGFIMGWSFAGVLWLLIKRSIRINRL